MNDYQAFFVSFQEKNNIKAKIFKEYLKELM